MNVVAVRAALMWLVSVGAGCTSAPVRYYTLTAAPDENLPAAKMPVAIDVHVVHTPAQLNRAELLIRTGRGEMTLLENERWTSPVNDEIKDALRDELRRRIGRLADLRPAVTKLTLYLDVQQLEAVFGQYASFTAFWRVTSATAAPPSDGAQSVACTFQANVKIRTGYAAMVEGYQREIAALADSILTVLTSPVSGGIDACRQSIRD